jgi:hypothetical protein
MAITLSDEDTGKVAAVLVRLTQPPAVMRAWTQYSSGQVTLPDSYQTLVHKAYEEGWHAALTAVSEHLPHVSVDALRKAGVL